MAKRNSQLSELLIVAQDDYLTIVDTSAGQSKRVSVKTLTGAPDFGWTATGEAWSFSSYSSSTGVGVITVPSNATTKYTVDMLVRFAQSTGGTKYGRILSVTTTTISVWMPGYILNNEAITSPVYSPLATPYGVQPGLRDSVPYKWNIWRNGSYTPGVGNRVQFNTKEFDTNNNADITTNVGRVTIPVTGYYQLNVTFNNNVSGAPQDPQMRLKKNGGAIITYGHFVNTYNGASSGSTNASVLAYLVAGDYLEVYTDSNLSIPGGLEQNNFTGFLASRL